MTRALDGLLAMDAFAHKQSCDGLTPSVRAAMVADARWPSKRAGRAEALSDAGPVPDNVVPLPTLAHKGKQSG